MIEVCRCQLNVAEGLIGKEVGELWEQWMPEVDELPGDEELVGTVYEALARRWPNSRTRGRKGCGSDAAPVAAELLKHTRNWSYGHGDIPY